MNPQFLYLAMMCPFWKLWLTLFLVCFGVMPLIEDLFTLGMQWLHAKSGGKPSRPYDDCLAIFFLVMFSIEFEFLGLHYF